MLLTIWSICFLGWVRGLRAAPFKWLNGTITIGHGRPDDGAVFLARDAAAGSFARQSRVGCRPSAGIRADRADFLVRIRIGNSLVGSHPSRSTSASQQQR